MYTVCIIPFLFTFRSGYLNPRSLIRAEQELASARGVLRKQENKIFTGFLDIHVFSCSSDSDFKMSEY